MDIFTKYFEEVETEEQYFPYFFSVLEAITIAILGTFCGLRNMKQIHQWASSERIREFLKTEFCILDIPSYYWFTKILGKIKPKSFSECFTRWVIDFFKPDLKNATISIDGKTVRSTEKMKKYENPLHIVSAQIAEYGITLGQKAVDGKTNEIPTVQELLNFLDIKGSLVVSDALNCQTKTAKAVIDGGGDYLLSVKDNQSNLKTDIADYVQDDSLRQTMDKATKKEKNRNRVETRTAYVTSDIEWLLGKDKWTGLVSIGAINTKFETEKGVSNEWHYYISSRLLSAKELLDSARKEWSVETMHWLLDVHFSEDNCRAISQNTQENLNIIRKFVINLMRDYKTKNSSNSAFTHLMLDCMLDPKSILKFFR